jgi:WD repeat-containing protein 19
VAEKEYLGTIEQIQMTDNYSAVLVERKLQLHSLDNLGDNSNDNNAANQQKSKLFPEKDDGPPITCLALTKDFLIFGTAEGNLFYFYLDSWSMVNEFRHEGGVGTRKLFPNSSGTRCIFIDNNNDGFLYSPVNDHLLKVPNFSRMFYVHTK